MNNSILAVSGSSPTRLPVAEPAGHGYTVGQALVAYLERQGVSIVFGIPGVHTVELYRGLAQSSIRHVTPRHEQGAGFMADGYARSTGRPGVAFVISGPGVTNIVTPMAQALADSVPMLVISSVNEARYLGKGLGHLHELPDQQALVAQVARHSSHVNSAAELIPALDDAFARFASARPGPVHIQVPLDVFADPFDPDLVTAQPTHVAGKNVADQAAIDAATVQLATAERPVIIAGGGTKGCPELVQALADRLQAPVVQTINARGQMHGHPLRVPATPSLQAVRDLLDGSDVVLAIGSELGPTDFDIYNTGVMPVLDQLIRIDIDGEQLGRVPAEVAIRGDAADVLPRMLNGLMEIGPGGESGASSDWGAAIAAKTRHAARAELSPRYQKLVGLTETIRDTLPGSILVGDSTQLIYAANMVYGHDTPRGWFNSSVGFGALGYAIPASIGAALGNPGQQVVCITGDGGAQFTLPEITAAVDEQLSVIFIVWNNFAYQEIADAMEAADIAVVGCDPTPPNFADIARACFMPFTQCSDDPTELAAALAVPAEPGPRMIEIQL